jgi:ribosomal protein S18 acetylase RimI-like enzyme
MLEPAFRAGDTYTVDPAISRDDAIAFWTAPEKTVFMAEADRPLGTCYLKANQQGGGAHVCNAGFVTHPAARGKGAATAMLTHLERLACDRGYLAMQFNFVVSSNTGAIGLWRRAGFDTVGTLPRAFRHPDLGLIDALVMMKSLAED